jgi:hypothetical protein
MNALTTTARAGVGSLAPQTFGEAVEFSRMLARSGMVPKDYNGKPEAIMVALQWGAEVGLGPLQALNGISVINGKPSLWGDAALALVRGHPACAGIREGVEGEGDAMVGFCEVTRRGEQPQRRTFSVAEAKKAGLWGKPGPWQQYPQRMLQMRARGFAIRDVFPDALRGVITAEEAMDMPTEPRAVPNMAQAEPPARPLSEAVTEAAVKYGILAPSGAVHQVPPGRWLAAVQRALAGLESAEAVRAWRQEMGQHVSAVFERDDAMAMEADKLIGERLEDLEPDPAGAGEAEDVA